MSAVVVACVRQDVVFGANRRYLVYMGERGRDIFDSSDAEHRAAEHSYTAVEHGGVVVVHDSAFAAGIVVSRKGDNLHVIAPLQNQAIKRAYYRLKLRRSIEWSGMPNHSVRTYLPKPEPARHVRSNEDAMALAEMLYAPLLERLSRG